MDSASLDCLLVHVPKLLEWSPLLGWYARVNFLSMGILSIAEELERSGLRTRIVHVGVEKRRDAAWSLVERVRASGAGVVAFALHWHPQTYDTIEAARQLKEALPDVRVVLGGLTASYFAREILETWPFVDAVIRGEAERPLQAYVTAIVRGGVDLAAVDNLSWRDGGAVRENPLAWVSSSEDLDGWSFAAWPLVEHGEDYLRQNWRVSWEPEFRRASEARSPTLFGAALGRGCMGTCTWCAGSFAPMRELTGRKRAAWRRADRIAATVESARAAGVERIYTCFEPNPRQTREVHELLEALGALTPRVALDFESFGLPDADLIAAFGRHLDPSSRLIVSPEVADEDLRRRHRAFPFSNDALDEALGTMARAGVTSDLYFVLGLPGDDRERVLGTLAFQRTLRARHPSTIGNVFTWPLEMEPNAPWFRHPERYGITLRRRTLADFHAAHGARELSLGYDGDRLSEPEILELHTACFSGVTPEQRVELERFHRGRAVDYARVRDLR